MLLVEGRSDAAEVGRTARSITTNALGTEISPLEMGRQYHVVATESQGVGGSDPRSETVDITACKSTLLNTISGASYKSKVFTEKTIHISDKYVEYIKTELRTPSHIISNNRAMNKCNT